MSGVDSLKLIRQECMQDAFVLIWNRAGDYRADKAVPMTWMGAIARYRALDLLRKRKHELPLDEAILAEVPDESQPQMDDQLVNMEDAQRINECMAGLSRQQRSCIQLAYFDGYTHPEIAQHIDSPLGSVKTWIYRGMSSLKECLS
jgi:RNA polymerase sigma-70 factor (ECF subfamily)